MTRRPILLFLLTVLCLPAPAQGVGANGIKKGPWRDRGDIPEGWYVMEAGRYVFQSDAPRERIKKVAVHLNAAYKLYSKTFPTGRTPGKPFIVKIFKDRKGFLAYGAPPGAGAYYSWGDREMVGYDTGKLDGEVRSSTSDKEGGLKARIQRAMNKNSMDLLGVFAHEGWHQYFHFACASKISFPSWCDEGIGEYFYSMRHRDGGYEVGAPNDYRLGTIKAAIRSERFIPLKDLVTFDQQEYYRVAGLAYAQGWSLVHFFLEHPDYKSKRYLERFVRTFISEHSIEKAVERVFSRMDWDQVTADWKTWVMDMTVESAEEGEGAEADAVEKGLGSLPGQKDPEPNPPDKEDAPDIR
jgi:hypothetical protein